MTLFKQTFSKTFPGIFLFSIIVSSLFNSNSTFADNNYRNNNHKNTKLIRLATTTSTENSGLLRYLLPQFEKDSGYKVHTIAVGTGKALRMGRDGDVDVLLVHALKAEKEFIAKGHGVERFAVMMNDFVIVGSKKDPANISHSKTIEEAFKKIASNKSKFVSRGDDSGTHKKELGLWQSANLNPHNANGYLEAGQGMGKVLQMAGEMDAYTLTDRGTWLAYEKKSPLAIMFEGDSKLFNPYGIIAINPEKYPDINNQGANALIHWMISEKGQKLIGDFRIADKVLFKPSASSLAAAPAQ